MGGTLGREREGIIGDWPGRTGLIGADGTDVGYFGRDGYRHLATAAVEDGRMMEFSRTSITQSLLGMKLVMSFTFVIHGNGTGDP